MNPQLLGPVFEIANKIFDRLLPDPEKKAAAQLEILKMQQAGEFKQLEADLQLSLGQIEVNKVEAASDSLFKSGWRPATGWACVGGLVYQLLLRPTLGWIAVNLWGWTIPPALELDTLLTLLFGMLGLGAYRSFEKVKGVNR